MAGGRIWLGRTQWRREMIGALGTLGVAVATAMLACTLLVAPAFADSRAHSGIHQYMDCDQVQSVVGFQYNAGTSGDVNRELDITRDQERVCRGGKKADGVLADTIVEGTLPDTGGLSLPALAACALVVAGGFSITRLIGRRK
jgi:hypothetical protein